MQREVESDIAVQAGVVMDEVQLRGLLRRIETKYLHTPEFRLSAALKYVEVCTELLESHENTFDFADLDAAFTLVVKQTSQALDRLKARKSLDVLDVFFIKTIELFARGTERATRANQIENAHKCRLMGLDVHKLRLLAVSQEDEDARTFSFECIDSLVCEFPSDGRFWFQHAIIHASFGSSLNSLNSLSRALLARDNPIDAQTIAMFVRKRIHTDFSNTLICLLLKDFDDFVTEGIETWSFVKYFQSFTTGDAKLLPSELVDFFLFVVAFFKCSNNSFHFSALLDAWLNAQNRILNQLWPVVVYTSLKLCSFKDKSQKQSLHLQDSIWFRIFQLLKAEETILVSSKSLLLSSPLNEFGGFKSFFVGTILSSEEPLNNYSAFDFNEEFSLERDSIVKNIANEFFCHGTGPFHEFISLRLDNTVRLGSHLISVEDRDPTINTHPNRSITDASIDSLRTRLANISADRSSQTVPVEELNYFSSTFILDTNIFLANSQLIRDELKQNPEKFIVPLIVLHELSCISKSSNSDRKTCAKDVLDLLNSGKLLEQVQVLDNRGRQLESLKEISDQLKLLSQTQKHSQSSTSAPKKTLPDDKIINLALLYHTEHHYLPKPPVLLTDDANMRLKAKTKSVLSISMREFKNICNR